jgi:hypothetical protein
MLVAVRQKIHLSSSADLRAAKSGNAQPREWATAKTWFAIIVEDRFVAILLFNTVSG